MAATVSIVFTVVIPSADMVGQVAHLLTATTPAGSTSPQAGLTVTKTEKTVGTQVGVYEVKIDGFSPTFAGTTVVSFDGTADPSGLWVIGIDTTDLVQRAALAAMSVPTDPTLVTVFGYEGTAADPVVGAQVIVKAANALSFAGSRRFSTVTVYSDLNGYWQVQTPASTALLVSVAGVVKSLTSPASGSANWKDLS